MNFVQYWSGRTHLSKKDLTGLIDISSSKYYDWCRRQGQQNQHNSPVPRWFWLLPWEKEAILSFHQEHPEEGYRRLCFMMIDADVVAVSPSSVYRVLKEHGRIRPAPPQSSSKGDGFDQPTRSHQHWHIDIMHLKIDGTFYYLCGVLDGYSRYVVHWELREQMRKEDTQIIVQRAHEKHPGTSPRIISDRGSQFIAKDFEEFIDLIGLTHVKTSPHYPQSNGKYERWNRTLRGECIRPQTPLSLEDARRIVAAFVEHYNAHRLHSAIGYVAPLDKLEGRAEQIIARRREKLAAARRCRREANHREQNLTEQHPHGTSAPVGETEAGSAEEQPARDNRLGHATEDRTRVG